MAIDPKIRRSLPAAAQRAYDASDLSDTALRLKFGPQLRLDDEENPYGTPPTTALGQQMVSYANKCKRTWEQVREAHFRSLADKSVDHNTAFLRSAKSAKAKLSDLEAEAQGLMAQLDARTQHLATMQANALKPPASVGEATVDAEVRALMRAAKDPRDAAALAAVYPRAVATAPAEVVGLKADDATYRAAVDSHLRAAIPEVMAETDEVRAALDQFMRADKAVVELSRSIIDFDLADNLASGAKWNGD